MSTVSSTNGSGTSQAIWQQQMQQRKTDWQSLASALQSGDLTGAQQAFSSLQAMQTGGNQGASSTSPISSDFTALGKAIQSGDLNAAQTAFQKLQTDMQTMRAHHHHHHQGGTTQNTSDSDSDNSSTTDSTSSVSGVNTLA
jgi:DNA-binding FadR family transcriptional regulator